ncbi:MAG: MATE family efflux transporter [Clostridia bacterium]
MARDLTIGKPYQVILKFCGPILLGNLLQQIYNITDTVIVGQFVGINALAGVGSTSSLTFLILGFVMGTSTGFSIPISRCFGAKNYQGLKKYFTNAIYFAVFIAVILTFLTLFFMNDILTIMNTQSDVFSYAKTYISTIFAGMVGTFLYNFFAASLRAIGDSKTPLLFLMITAVLNIILDLIFVLGLGLGVFGTGLATIISQAVSATMCIIFINKKITYLQTKKEDWQFNIKTIGELFRVGVPMGLQFSIAAIGAVILQSAVNTLGTTYVAAIAAGSRISYFAMNALDTLGLTMATFTGQNIGAGKLDRLNQGVRHALLIGIIYSISMFILLFFFGKYIILIFVNASETEVIANTMKFLLIDSSGYIICTFLHVFRNTVQGSGYSAVAMFAGVMEMIARIFVATVLITAFGYNGAIFSNPTAWFAAVLFLVPTYLVIIKKLKKKQAEKLAQA